MRYSGNNINLNFMYQNKNWNWEIAYKKWFWVRFVLLLIALGLCSVLAYIQFRKDPESAVVVNQASNTNNQLRETSIFDNHMDYADMDMGRGQDYERDEKGWTVYKNDQYKFEIKYPSSWRMFYSRYSGPEFILIKPDQNKFQIGPYRFFTDSTNIMIRPNGYPGEGLIGKTRESNILFKEKIKSAVDYLFADGTPWATFVWFENEPEGWDGGFISASPKVLELYRKCINNANEVNLDWCGIDGVEGSELFTYGQVNSEDRKIIEEILGTFKFIK